MKDAFDRAIARMKVAQNQVDQAYVEVARYQHPVAMEIGGISKNIMAKLERLNKLRNELK